MGMFVVHCAIATVPNGKKFPQEAFVERRSLFIKDATSEDEAASLAQKCIERCLPAEMDGAALNDKPVRSFLLAVESVTKLSSQGYLTNGESTDSVIESWKDFANCDVVEIPYQVLTVQRQTGVKRFIAGDSCRATIQMVEEIRDPTDS